MSNYAIVRVGDMDKRFPFYHTISEATKKCVVCGLDLTTIALHQLDCGTAIIRRNAAVVATDVHGVLNELAGQKESD